MTCRSLSKLMTLRATCPGMFHGGGSNDFFHLRDIGAVHAERRQTESQQ